MREVKIHKKIVGLIVVAGIVLGFAGTSQAAWLSGYSYRKAITITGQTGAGTDYQVSLSIGDSSGGDFHLEGHCANFPNDITFTDDDGSTELYYWIEDTTADPITVWVEVADSLESNVNIYCYYSNASDNTDDSDGTNTFEFFDDFEDGVYTDKWSIEAGSASESGGILTLTGASSVLSISNVPSFGWRIIERSTAINADQYAGSYLDVYSTGSNDYIRKSEERFGGIGFKLAKAGDNFGSGSSQTSSFIPGWHTYDWAILGTSVNIVRDVTGPSLGQTLNANFTVNPLYKIRLGGMGANDGAQYDYIRIRKYASPEPSFSSAGSEEGAPTTLLRDAVIRDATIR